MDTFLDELFRLCKRYERCGVSIVLPKGYTPNEAGEIEIMIWTLKQSSCPALEVFGARELTP